MAAGDTTILGPYQFNTAGINTASGALTGLQSGVINDQTTIINDMNGAFYIMWTSG